jgi:hypothetical protein
LTPRELDAARAIARDGHLAAVDGTALDALDAVWDLIAPS